MRHSIVIRTEADRAEARRWIDRIQIGGPVWEVVVGPFKRHRTNSQNRLYWALLHALARDTGNDADMLHEYMKRRFIKPEIREAFGDRAPYWSTKGLDTAAFSEFFEQVQAFCAEQGTVLEAA